jgi:CDP-diacylglycerol---glycerol-3-phosphate 3-phosphatidyltransferase
VSDIGSKSPSPPHDELTFGTTPNMLTLLRMAFVPVVVGLLFVGKPEWDLAAALVFGVASITDYFDGYIARTRKLVTVYGKLMDPLADKFLIVSSLVMLQYLERIHPLVVILLVCRELAITGLRALASAEGVIIPASPSTKWKTVAQMVAIPFIMVKQGLFGIPLFPIGLVLLYVSLGISLWSAKDYIVDFFRALKESRRKRMAEKKQARETRLAARAARRATRSGQDDSPPGP